MVKKCKILLVEDDADISKAIAFRLKKEGHQVVTACDGEKGLALVTESSPDLVVLDLMLPALSGEEVCKKIREHDDEKTNKIPIIMLTAKNSQVDGIVGRVIGASSYMTKPFLMEDLIAQIQKLTVDQKA